MHGCPCRLVSALRIHIVYDMRCVSAIVSPASLPRIRLGTRSRSSSSRVVVIALGDRRAYASAAAPAALRVTFVGGLYRAENSIAAQLMLFTHPGQ